MPDVQLTDVIDYQIYRNVAAESAPELTAYFQSGVVVGGASFDRDAASDGDLVEMIAWRDIDPNIEPNYSTDQPTEADPNKIAQFNFFSLKSHLNNGWSAYDLARELQTGNDAMREIRRRTDPYWMRQWQRRLIACTEGILAANLAGNEYTDVMQPGTAGDMVFDATTGDDLQNSVTDANRFSRDAFLAAKFTLGDHNTDIAAMSVHSTVYQRMLKNDDIDYIVDSMSTRTIPVYMGVRVIVDDAMPTTAITGGFEYTCVLWGKAAFGYGKADPQMPVEVDRNPRAGHGGGQEELWERKTWLIHPFGFNNTGAVKTATNTSDGKGRSQNLADLKDGANWERVLSRKNVPLAFLIVND